MSADGGPPDRLARQLDFLLAVDALKRVVRASPITGGSRRENSAEHSWHVALCAQLLAEHANAPVDVARVTTMMLVHDIVEVDVGDAPLHGPQDPDRHARESAAAARLFGLLPSDQAETLETLWHEFESGAGIDARFARALDRLQPMLLNAATGGGTWVEYAVTRGQLVRRTGHVADGSKTLWAHCERMIDEAVTEGWVRDGDDA